MLEKICINYEASQHLNLLSEIPLNYEAESYHSKS